MKAMNTSLTGVWGTELASWGEVLDCLMTTACTEADLPDGETSCNFLSCFVFPFVLVSSSFRLRFVFPCVLVFSSFCPSFCPSFVFLSSLYFVEFSRFSFSSPFRSFCLLGPSVVFLWSFLGPPFVVIFRLRFCRYFAPFLSSFRPSRVLLSSSVRPSSVLLYRAIKRAETLPPVELFSNC